MKRPRQVGIDSRKNHHGVADRARYPFALCILIEEGIMQVLTFQPQGPATLSFFEVCSACSQRKISTVR